jgi:hypothetical protein
VNGLKVALDELAAAAPVNRASWSDVQARARRPRRRRTLLAVAVLMLSAVVVATPAFGIRGRLLGLFEGTPVKTERLSAEELHVLSAMTHGVSPRVPASQREDVARFEASSLRQIATRNGRAFFVANVRGGGLCVSVARIGGPRLLGSISCTPDFPSASRPILDESVFTGLIGKALIPLRFEGFAADGVASVALMMGNGELTAETPVEANVYSRTEGLPKQPITATVALDADGNRLHVLCFAVSDCDRKP